MAKVMKIYLAVKKKLSAGHKNRRRGYYLHDRKPV